MKAPSFVTIGNFIHNELTDSMEQIFIEVNSYIFEEEHMDLGHTYIDGTKMEANANRSTWVWKKSCLRNRNKVFEKISVLIDTMNTSVLNYLRIKLEKRNEYAIDYVAELLANDKEATMLDITKFVSGIGRRKSMEQRQYQEMQGNLKRLKAYANDAERKETAIQRQTMPPHS